jgi:hypothetical protein
MPYEDIAFARVNAGTWTMLYSGPSFQLWGQQMLTMRTAPRGTPDYSVNWSWRRYSAVPPFYYQISGTSTAEQTPATSTPLFVLSGSPWTDIWLLTDRTVDAKVFP